MVAKKALYNAYPSTKYRAPHVSMTPQLMSSRNASSDWEAMTVVKSTASGARPWVWAQPSIHALWSSASPKTKNSPQLSTAQPRICVNPTKPMPAIFPANNWLGRTVLNTTSTMRLDFSSMTPRMTCMP